MRRSFQGPSARASQDGSAAQRYKRTAPRRARAPWWLFLGGLLFLAAGCKGGDLPGVIKFSPQDAAAGALAEYDANKDGALDVKELNKCPSLREAMSRGLDKNKDGRVTEDELEERMSIYQEEGMLGSVMVEVRLDGNGLRGATVTLTPEKFMGASFKPATGTTDASGSAVLQVEGLEQGVVPYGHYRIEVSRQGAGGKELIPARYNTQTILGREVAPARALDSRGENDSLVLRLTSR